MTEHAIGIAGIEAEQYLTQRYGRKGDKGWTVRHSDPGYGLARLAGPGETVDLCSPGLVVHCRVIESGQDYMIVEAVPPGKHSSAWTATETEATDGPRKKSH